MTAKSTISISIARHFSVALLAACLAWPAANGQTMQSGMGSMKPSMAASAPMGSGDMDIKETTGMKDMKGMMEGMNEKMTSMPMSGNPDTDFAAMMRIHHQGAIDMAQAELKDGKNAQMRTMAKNIIAAQKKEIAQFDKFLAAQDQSADKMKMSK